MNLSRRGLLGTAGLGLVSGCGQAGNAQSPSDGRGTTPTRHRYGQLHPDQFGDLYLPADTPRGTIVLLHGGYWFAEYSLSLMGPIARTLVHAGWAVWNLEYRRLGGGGGWPATFTDVAAGVDHVARLQVPGRPVLLGHSAGGQLAVWAASRDRRTPGGASAVAVRGAVSLSGVLDLTFGAKEFLGNGAVPQLMGGTPEQVARRYDLGDPTRLVPAHAPVWCVYAQSDQVVPPSQSSTYAAATRRRGGKVELLGVPGDHFALIDPTSAAWKRTVPLLSAASAAPG